MDPCALEIDSIRERNVITAITLIADEALRVLQERLDELEVDDGLAAELLVSADWAAIRKLARRAADMLLTQERPH